MTMLVTVSVLMLVDVIMIGEVLVMNCPNNGHMNRNWERNGAVVTNARSDESSKVAISSNWPDWPNWSYGSYRTYGLSKVRF